MVEDSFNHYYHHQQQQQELSNFYHHYPQQYLMTMQQQNNYNFTNSSSTASRNIGENNEKVMMINEKADCVEETPPQFFDFLGVGATTTRT